MGDMISRQAAITAIQKAYADTEGGADRCAVWKNVGLTNALHIMQDLPSGQTEKMQLSKEDATKDATFDCISRQAAIDTLDVGAECLRRVLDETDIVGTEREKYKWGLGLFEACISDMKELPSAQPERKEGKWIYAEHDIAMCDGYMCDQCGFFVPWDYKHKFIDFIKDYHWCPSCGADMRGEQDE